MFTLNDNTWSRAVSLVRRGRGTSVRGGRSRRPERLLEVWDMEACPYCRKVREGLSELDLEYLCHPAGRGSNNRDATPEHDGRKYFPYLVDPNTGVKMKESEDILDYLHSTYGEGRRPQYANMLAPLDTLGSMLASGLRPKGLKTSGRVATRAQPTQNLMLYQFEGCPFSRKVRERLHELNLDFHVKSAAKGSPRRDELRALAGRVSVPYLVDPNTDAAMFESNDILAYLDAHYA